MPSGLIRQLGLQVDNLGIRVEGEQVTLTGKIESQAEREKIVLLVGKIEGVGRVVGDSMLAATTTR